MTDKEKEDLQDLHDSLILMCKYKKSNYVSTKREY